MKKILVSIILLFIGFEVYAQPSNDNCLNAIPISVGPSCSLNQYTTTGATPSGEASPGCGGSTINDVWFSAVVPASGKLIILTDTVALKSGAMAIYRGTTCGALTLIECATNGSMYNTYNMPGITRTDLVPGETIYIRFWKKSGVEGTFKLCVYEFGPGCSSGNPSPADNCADAPFLCNLDGFCGVTYEDPIYTPDEPAISGCAAGYSINNNSWLKFIAASNMVSLTAWVYGCTNNLGSLSGIQIALMEGDCSTGFTALQCGTNPSGNNTQINFSFNNLVPGNLYYFMIDGYAGDFCNYTIKGNYGILTVDAGADTTVCEGATFTRTATGFTGGSYNWYNDRGLSSLITAGGTLNVTASSAQSPKTYYLEALGNPLCPTATIDSFTVVTGALPTAFASATPNSVCAGSQVSLNSSGATSYSWVSNPVGFTSNIQNPTVNPTVTTTYTVTASNGGACSASQSAVVTILPTPSVDAGSSQTICNGSSATLTVIGVGTYEWDNTQNTNSITVNPSTTTTYTVTVTNNGCSASDNVTVIVTPLPIADAGAPQTICIGNSATLNASGGTSYQWSTTENTQSINVSPVVQSTYTVTVTNNNCSATDAVSVSIAPALVVDLGSDYTICNVSNTPIDAGITGTGISYRWSPGSETTQIIHVNAPGTYTVTVTNSLGCEGIDNITIGEYPQVNASISPAGPIDLCTGSSISLSVIGGTNFLWSSGASLSSISVNPIVNTTYTVTVTDANTCTGLASVNINIIQLPVLDLGADMTICEGNSATLVANATGNSYSWSTGAVSTFISVNTSGVYSVDVNTNCGVVSDDISVTVNPKPFVYLGQDSAFCVDNFVLSTPGTFDSYLWSTGAVSPVIIVNSTDDYSLTVTDVNGCSNSDIVTITDSCNLDIYIPNAFTPQGDGLNETFKIRSNNIDEIELFIYSRWGELMFNTKDINDSWDGKYNGTQCQGGVYFYVLNYRRKSVSFNSISGSVTLLR